jgi:hypothetical protein
VDTVEKNHSVYRQELDPTHSPCSYTDWVILLSLSVTGRQFCYIRFEVFTAVTMKNVFFWYVAPCGLVRTGVSEERVAYIFREERFSELER